MGRDVQEDIVRIGTPSGWKVFKYHDEWWRSFVANSTLLVVMKERLIAYRGASIEIPDLISHGIKGTIKTFPFSDCRIFHIVVIWADLNFEW